MLNRRRILALQGAVAWVVMAPAWAQPTTAGKPLRLIVPYPPGGPLDVIARALAHAVKDSLGVVVVDNKAGAGGNLGADLAAKATPDGHTLVMGAVATHAINPWLYRQLPYHPLRDFTPVTGVAQVPNVLVMNAEVARRLAIQNLADLVRHAKRHPGQLNYGSGGNGSAGHLAGELFKTQAGLFIVHIPYAGGNPAQLALLSGQVDLSFDNLATASANIRAGKLIALAVTTRQRAGAMPDVPTMAEAGAALGLAQFDIHTWFGLFGPAGMPPEVTGRLNQAFTAALATSELKARLASLMAESFATSPEQFGRFVQAEHQRYQAIVKASGATVD